MSNYYDILGINKNASQEEIKKAYRELSKKYHPDRNGGDDTKFKEINEAYSTLNDPEKRREYDNPLKFNGWNNGGFHFSNFRQMASDITVSFTISINDAYFGCSRIVNINGRNISIDIPKGVTDGKILKIPEMGQKGRNVYGEETTGDLIVKIKVLNDNKLWLSKPTDILETVCSIDWIDAILGGEHTITIFDREVKFKIPKYSQNGGYTIVGKQGFHKFKSDELGSLKINFIIKMPKNLTSEQLEHLKLIKESL